MPTEAVQRPKPRSYNLQLLCGHGADRPMDNTDRASSVPVGALWAFFFLPSPCTGCHLLVLQSKYHFGVVVVVAWGTCSFAR